MSIHTLVDEWAKMPVVDWAQNKFGWILESKMPIVLSSWQTAVLGEYWKRKEDVSTLLVSTVKKSGKTTITSLIVSYRWLTIPSVHFVVANDASQVEELQFNIISSMIARHPILRKYSKVTKDTILFEPTGSRIESLPMDAAGAAGANFATVSFSELWGYRYEEGQRLYEELTPVPLADCLRVIDSYAGYSSESELLQRVWDRGLTGQRINEEWPVFLVGQQLSYIHQGEEAQKACWRGDEKSRLSYYAEQKDNLRENTYARLHLNEWKDSTEETFISSEQWEACYNPAVKPLQVSDKTPVVLALDLARGLSPGRDTAALTAVCRWSEHDFAVKYVKVWEPPFDFDDIVSTLLMLIGAYNCVQLTYDEYESTYIVKKLTGKIWLEPFNQMSERDKADRFLFDSISGKRVHHFNDAGLNAHIAAAGAISKSENKIRIVKTSRRKIDAAVSLSMGIWKANSLTISPDPASQTEDKMTKLYRMLETKGLFNPLKSQWDLQKEFYKNLDREIPVEPGPILIGYLGGLADGSVEIETTKGREKVFAGSIYEVSGQVWANLQKPGNVFRQGSWVRLIDG